MRTGFWWGFLKERGHWGSPKRRWADNNKGHLKEVGWKGVDWVDLVWNRDKWLISVNTIMNVPVLRNAANLLTSRRTITFPRSLLL
jgi:hypothetical protein